MSVITNVTTPDYSSTLVPHDFGQDQHYNMFVDRSPADKLDVSILQSQISDLQAKVPQDQELATKADIEALQSENAALKTKINYLIGFIEGLTDSIRK